MTQHDHELWQQLDRLQMTLRQAAAQLVEVRSQVAALKLPERSEHKCPNCGIVRKSAAGLAEHVYVSHGSPVPEHYQRAEGMADA